MEIVVPVLPRSASAVTADAPSFTQQLIEIAHRFAEAEVLLKQAERLSCELPIPLINELRYAGSHLSRYFLEKDTIRIEEEIAKAKNHCERVVFDAYEIMLNYYLDNFIHFGEQYAVTSLTDIIPDYLASRKTVREARDFVEKHTRKEERVCYCIQAREHLEKLKTLWEVYDDAREEIFKKRKRERHQFLFALGGFLIAVAGVVVGLCKLL